MPNLRLDGLRNGTNLVNLEQETVASLLLDGSLDTERVGDGQVITDDLDTGVLGEVAPGLPVVLVEGVLNGDNGVVLDVGEVEIGELDTGDPLGWVGVGVLEVEVVLAVLVELGGSDIESDLNLALVSGLLDGLSQELERLLSTRHVGGESTLITDVDG